MRRLGLAFQGNGFIRAWFAIGVLAAVGMLVVTAVMLTDMRRDAWSKTEQASRNLLQVIERDIARNVEMIDLSLSGVIDNLAVSETSGLSPALRQLILFDRAASAKDLGVMLVLDEHGDAVFDSSSVPARRLNNSDRDYFKAHKASPDTALHISRPLISRLTGARSIVLSRRINKPDGSFGGLVLGTLKLSYFGRMFDSLGLGRDGAINLYLNDGTRIVRYPYLESDVGANIAGAPSFETFVREGSGSYVGVSVKDGIERYYSFTHVADHPLILSVALSTQELDGAWRAKALVIASIVLVLCGAIVGLILLLNRELHRRDRAQAELALLSRTDALTGLPNRRQFEESFATARAAARRSGEPLALLVVDADHFKRHNDRYGHAVGDEVLKGIARSLNASVHRPLDMVCRVGGEEFVMLLPNTDEAGALRVAEKVHGEIATIEVPLTTLRPGAVTVSIGVAVRERELEALYKLADAALYEAKEAGRNRTRCAPAEPATSGAKLALTG